MPGGGNLVAMDLDRDGGAPLYRQLYEGFRLMILDGRLPSGSRLPANRVLAQDLALSRNTVANALQQLLAEGYVETRKGDGTYVASELPDARPNTLERRRGEHLASRQLSPDRPGHYETPQFTGAPRHYGLSRRGSTLAAISRTPYNTEKAFAPGPDLKNFPFDIWARLMTRFWRRPSSELTVSRDAGGYPPLKAAIAAYLGAMRGVRCDPGQIIIVSGAQQAINLAAQVLLDHDDQALVEEPGYGGIRGALTAAGIRTALVPVDDEGMDIAQGESRAPLARFACVAPSHQFPLGVVMSLRRRLALIEWARRRQGWILEDDYDSEYRYSGRPLAALQGLDTTGRVIYVGSFSKVLFPALRLGYLVVPPDLVDPFIRARRVLDDHAAMLAQPVLASFIEDGHFAAHVRRMRRLYAARQDALLDTAKRELSGLLDIAADEAGMHLIAWPGDVLSGTMDDNGVVTAAAQSEVTAMALSATYAGKPARHGLMLGYAAHTEEAIVQGVRCLASIFPGQG
ncbi:MAG: PLP-dependent aminotransferase family protein [Rhodospirillaceae bacterium]|jgi:GntR family transcriptional regulator/MocR family aminotransferase|nr:PLP-dependent aminotransferase family protein [Rhodospirillaceae bacterium]MBT4691338.1 PLP-dependent aminotransferase family protein [Rhodospirillaceae bacterium]MBT5081394.1 PLP-dependent aminotransferase family protein [Rhodospirillaceae bacterium]MBT5522878.1 PLP-dependent aminotransferase family protein [Rhodospirillaceae bacterium]MBT5880887.1 PLP-dependent aminotransferase family protein [Rhodospirillaceae bacterium]